MVPMNTSNKYPVAAIKTVYIVRYLKIVRRSSGKEILSFFWEVLLIIDPYSKYVT